MIVIESKRKKIENILKKYPNAIIADVTSQAKDGLVKGVLESSFLSTAAWIFYPAFSTPGAKIHNSRVVFQIFPPFPRPFRSIWEKSQGCMGKGVGKSGRFLQGLP